VTGTKLALAGQGGGKQKTAGLLQTAYWLEGGFKSLIVFIYLFCIFKSNLTY
jgi:hypothetical protein